MIKLGGFLRNERLCRAFLGYEYPIFVAVCCVISHISSLELLFGSIIVATSSAAVLTTDSLIPLISPAACICYHISRYESAAKMSSPDSYISGLGLLILIGMVGIVLITLFRFFLFRWPTGILKNAKVPLLLPAILLSFAFLLNGVGSENYTSKNLAVGIFEILTFFFFFYIFFFGLLGEDVSVLTDRVCFTSALIALIISAELLWLYMSDELIFISGAIVKERIVFGWGIWNTAGSMLSVAIPACFLGAMRSKMRLFYLISATLGYVAAIFTLSRGALAVSTTVYIVCFAISLFFGNEKRLFRAILPVLLAVASVAVLVFSGKLTEALRDYFERGFSDNGRFALWRAGISDFLSAPLFGRGFFGVSAPADFASNLPGMLHSTPIQLLASCGIAGFFAYVYYRLSTLIKTFAVPSLEKTMLWLSILAVLLGSFLDNFVFYMHQMIYPSIALAIIYLLGEEKGSFIFKKFQKTIDIQKSL